MREFVKQPHYKNLLETLEKRDIKNKNGESFTDSALKTLLTNQRYIGRWEVNAHNKDRDQDQLQPFDRYTVIEDLNQVA